MRASDRLLIAAVVLLTLTDITRYNTEKYVFRHFCSYFRDKHFEDFVREKVINSNLLEHIGCNKLFHRVHNVFSVIANQIFNVLKSDIS